MAKDWEVNVLHQSILFGTNDFAEGLDAARNKRTGVFNGT
jgi:hypothetical protein